MHQKAQQRLEQLIAQGESLLSTVIEKPSDIMGSFLAFSGNGSELFTQWKHSSKKVLRTLSDDDYNGFADGEKHKSFESQPEVLRRLVSILKASLDDLNCEILGSNVITEKAIKSSGDTIHYHSINNYGNIANHGNKSTINQTSSLTIDNKGDFSYLASQLKEYGVQEDHIQDLKNIIDVSPSPESPENYSDGVNSWIGKISVKAMTESWDVVKGVGIGIFPELIKMYYGL